MLETIKAQMEQALAADGITAEVTFCRSNMLSVLVDDEAQFERAKRIMSRAATLESEDRDPEFGFIAYYLF